MSVVVQASLLRARPSGKAECRALPPIAVAAAPPARGDRDELEEDKRAPFAGRFLGHAPASTSRGTGRDCVLFEDGHSVVGIPPQPVFSKTFAQASTARSWRGRGGRNDDMPATRRAVSKALSRAPRMRSISVAAPTLHVSRSVTACCVRIAA